MAYSENQRDILESIVSRTKDDLAGLPQQPCRGGTAAAPGAGRRDFEAALRSNGFAVIAEVKKASPSAGIIREDYDPAAIARSYNAAGAAAISVLTEPHYFMGKVSHLQAVRDAVPLPLLRKDFIIDERQIHESAASGADAVLLIARILSERDLVKFVRLCFRLHISPLVEIHDEGEAARATASGARVIGINNRDLGTFKTDIERTFRLLPLIPRDRLVVSESGIREIEDIKRLAAAGVRAALVGERLLRAPDPGAALSELLKGAL